MPEPNEWGVTLDVTDEAVAKDLDRWDWGDSEPLEAVQRLVEAVDALVRGVQHARLVQAISVSAARAVISEIRKQTMANIDADGTVTMGLFEFEMPLRVSLRELVDGWIGARSGVGVGVGREYVAEAEQLAALLETLAARLRDALQEKSE